jgi:hypothetical protein
MKSESADSERQLIGPTPAETLMEMAAECRRLADAVGQPVTRRELIQMAERFRRLARKREIKAHTPGTR